MVVAFFIAIGILVFIYFYIDIRTAVINFFVKQREERLMAETEKVQAEIKYAYEHDFDGGKTPEETIELFLGAVKAGDITLASKYYELTVQHKALASLKEELAKNGNLNNTINAD